MYSEIKENLLTLPLKIKDKENEIHEQRNTIDEKELQKKLIEEYQKIMNEKNIKIQFVPHITLMRLNDETREVVARNISDIKNFGNNLKGKQISFDNIFINAGPQKYELRV